SIRRVTSPNVSCFCFFFLHHAATTELYPRSLLDALPILFNEPVRLGLFAYEEAPGVQCRLFALVPRSSLEPDAHTAEPWKASVRSEEHTSELQSRENLVCRLLLGKKIHTIYLYIVRRFKI